MYAPERGQSRREGVEQGRGRVVNRSAPLNTRCKISFHESIKLTKYRSLLVSSILQTCSNLVSKNLNNNIIQFQCLNINKQLEDGHFLSYSLQRTAIGATGRHGVIVMERAVKVLCHVIENVPIPRLHMADIIVRDQTHHHRIAVSHCVQVRMHVWVSIHNYGLRILVYYKKLTSKSSKKPSLLPIHDAQ